MYLYVDAAYLRRVFDERLGVYLERSIEIYWPAVRSHFGAERAFVYDCLNDILKKGETSEAFQARLHSQQEALDEISSLDGFFVRLGTMRGDIRKRRQKEVDVLLAVDMLTHSHRKITNRAVLIAGDLDFKPVVDAVVEQGTFVTIAYDATSASRDLARAADSQRLLTLQTLWNLSTGPQDSSTAGLFPTTHKQKLTTKAVRSGKLRGGIACLHRESDKWILNLEGVPDLEDLFPFSHTDEAKLIEFADAELGRIEWGS